MTMPASSGEAGDNAHLGYARMLSVRDANRSEAILQRRGLIATPPIVRYHESLLKRMETWIHGIP